MIKYQRAFEYHVPPNIFPGDNQNSTIVKQMITEKNNTFFPQLFYVNEFIRLISLSD